MTMYDMFSLLVFLALAIWGVYTVTTAMQQDRNWSTRLKAFAEKHGLSESRATGSRQAPDLDLRELRKLWSDNPARMAAAEGTTVYTGQLHGRPFTVDQLVTKGGAGGQIRTYLRMAVDIPGLPPGLAVQPAGRLWRWWQKIKSRGEQQAGYREPRRLRVAFSETQAERAAEKAFMIPQRVQSLDKAQQQYGDIYIADGKLFLIRERRGRKAVDLDKMHRLLAELAEALHE